MGHDQVSTPPTEASPASNTTGFCMSCSQALLSKLRYQRASARIWSCVFSVTMGKICQMTLTWWCYTSCARRPCSSKKPQETSTPSMHTPGHSPYSKQRWLGAPVFALYEFPHAMWYRQNLVLLVWPVCSAGHTNLTTLCHMLCWLYAPKNSV